MTTRTVTAAAALAAAVSVSAVALLLVQRQRCRRLERQAVAHRLMAGCEVRDNAALRAQVEVFRARLEREFARQAAVEAAGRVVGEALAEVARIDPSTEGGLA